MEAELGAQTSLPLMDPVASPAHQAYVMTAAHDMPLLAQDVISFCACADKQVFPKLDTVGWYSTGSSIGRHDMQIHKLVGCLTPS